MILVTPSRPEYDLALNATLSLAEVVGVAALGYPECQEYAR